jgi:hypothetical protein
VVRDEYFKGDKVMRILLKWIVQYFIIGVISLPQEFFPPFNGLSFPCSCAMGEAAYMALSDMGPLALIYPGSSKWEISAFTNYPVYLWYSFMETQNRVRHIPWVKCSATKDWMDNEIQI